MSCVHYKFKSSLDYDTLKFDGLHITLADLKKAIIQQKKLGKATDFDLQVINAQTKEEYGSNEDLIPRNASVIIARVPIGGKPWEKSQVDTGSKAKALKMSLERLSKTADLVGADASEEDKIKAMMTQSTKDYDRSNYVKPSYPTGPPPTGYLCYRCGQAGHFIQNCSLPKPDRHMDSEPARIKRSSGIPNSFLTIVDDPNVRGAVMTSSGRLAVPTIDAMAYERGKKEKPPFIKSNSPERRVSDEKMIPGELLCTLCNDLLADAVVIPCCGNSYCDECIREALLETEDHTCPACKESVSPDGLIANKFLRTAVNNFLNETGYTKARRRSSKHEEPPTQAPMSRQRPRDRDDDRHSDRKQVQPVSASDLMVLRQEAPLSDELIGLPPQVVKARQAELTRGSSPQGTRTTPPRNDYRSRHHDDRRRDDRDRDRRRDDRRDDRRHNDRRRDDRDRDRDRHHTPCTPTADEPMMSPPQQQMMQQMGQQQQQQQQPQMMPPQQQPQGPMGMPPQQPPQQQNMVPQFNQGPPQNKFFSPPMVNNGPPPGSVPPGTMRPPMNMPGPPPPGLQMPQQQCVPQQPPPPGASMPMMPNQFQPQGPIQQPPPQPMPPQMIPPQQPMQQGPMQMMPMPGPMPPGFRGPAPPGPQMGMPGPPGGDPRLPLPPNWGPRPPFPAPGPPPMSEQEFYREKQRLLEKTKPIHPRHDPMDDFEMQLMRYHSERRKNKSFSRSRSRSKSPATRLRSSRSKSRPLSHSRSRSRSRSVKRSRSRSIKRSRSRSVKRSRSRSKKRSRSRSKKRSRSRSKNRSRSRSKKRSRSWSKKRSRSRSKKRSRSRSIKRSRSRPRSFGRSLSRTRSSSSWSSKLSRSRSRSRNRRRSLSRSLSKSPQPRARRRKRSRSPGHRASSPPPPAPPGGPPGGFYNYRGRRSRSPPMPPYMRGGKEWVSPPGFIRDRSPGRMKGYSPERYPYPYAAQPRFEEMYRYPDRVDPRWLEYYREYDNYMREMQDRFGPPPPRYDMPWPGSGGISPPLPPPQRPVVDMHRSRSKLKKEKKGSRHGHDQRELKPTQKESEKERRQHREKGKLRDGEKEARVKKAPSGGHEEKAALRHAMAKQGADRGPSRSPHGKLRKRREEGGAPPLKDLRTKLTEKPADVKVMAAAVSVKAPKVESTDKTLPKGEAIVPVKKVRKSKVKTARVKGSKKVKKEALNGDSQVSEKTVKRPASAYPSAGVQDVVSPPKKAKMEADTTCHEDEIPTPDIELKVADVKVEKEEPAPGGKEIPQQIGLVVTPPELSKWERDDYNMNDIGVSPRRKPELKKLPRSVIESAEKVLSQKRPQVVASTVVSSPPSRSTSHKPTKDKEVERDRKVVTGGASCVQVTITSSSSDKRHSSTDRKLVAKEGRKKEVTTEVEKWKGERRGEVGEKRREAGGKYREEGTKYREEGTKFREEGKYREEGTKFREAGSRHQEVGSRHQEISERRKDAGDRHRDTRDVKALKLDTRRSSRDDVVPRHKNVSKVDPDNVPSSRGSLEKENKLGKSSKSREDEDGHREHTQPGRHISRKISVMDEANFEPDYNEDSQSDSESETKASKVEEDDSSGSSSEEQKKKKKKKHKHKHRKHKHKKHKHK